MAEIKLDGKTGHWRKKLVFYLRVIPWPVVLIIFIFLLFAVVPSMFGVEKSMIDISLSNRLLPPSWSFHEGYFLGTDHVGRDVWAMVVIGARVTLQTSIIALLLAAAVGSFIGIIAAYYGGMVGAIIMRLVDATFSLPTMLLALMLAISLGPSTGNVIIAILAVLWARFARIVRGEVLVIMKKDFILYAKVAGRGDLFTIFHHIVPNVTHTILVLTSLNIGWVIVTTATLSFLGAGIPPVIPNWGNMLSEARGYITISWWMSVFPGAAIFLITMAFNVFGDWLRDFMDPKLRQA